MWIKIWNAFVKITAWPVQFVCFRTKVYYEDKAAQSRCIRGQAMIISNHTSVFDYAVYLFVFFFRTLRFQMAEVLFRKPFLGVFLKWMGGIPIDRNAFNFNFLADSQEILGRGGVVGVFPESRLPLPGEERPLPFKPSAAYLALASGAPIIPVYTNGKYFSLRRARVIIGRPLNAAELTDPELSDKENIRLVSEALRKRITELEELLREKCR